MTQMLTDHQTRLLRIRAQRLLRDESDQPATVAQIVAATGGMQAQDAAAATLTLRPRSDGLTAADVERARVDERSVTRTWCLRGTIHLVATDDLVWIAPLLFPVFMAAGRRRRLELGLDAAASARGVHAIRDHVAACGPSTRAELREHVGAVGVPVAAQALAHLLNLAALHGVICFGPMRGSDPTFVLRDDWLGPLPELSHDIALAEIARRHLLAFGPARPEDLAAWSGLPLGQARAGWRAIAGELLDIEVRGQPAWLHTSRAAWRDDPAPSQPMVSLTAAFDTYLLGYRGRELAVAPEHAHLVLPGGGMLRPTLLVDGQATATWSLKRRGYGLEVVVEPYAELDAMILATLEREAADVGRFLGARATLSVA